MADPKFKDISVEDINDTYKQGYITAAKKNDLMRRKAEHTLDEILNEKGYFGAILSQTVKHVQEGWDNIIADIDLTESSRGNLKKLGQAIWGEIQVLTAAFAAVGEVSGQKAEQMALAAGASPGLAKVINVAVDVGTGFLPVGGAAQSAVKGFKGVVEASKAARAGGAAAKGAEAAAKAEEAAKLAKHAEKVVDDAIQQGLTADGVEVFRGGAGFEKVKVGSSGVSVSLDKDIAERFAKLRSGSVERFELDPKAKTVKVGELMDEVYKIHGNDVKQPFDKAADLAKQKGFDVVDMALSGEKELRVLNPDVLKLIGPQDDFVKSLRAYRREMEALTETKTHAMTLAEADKLGIGLKDLQALAPGTALKESEMAAYLKALDGPVDDLVSWAKKTLADEEGAGLTLAKKLGEFFQYSPKFRAAEVTAGRSVEILKETPPMKPITDMLMSWDPEAMAKMDIAAATRTLAEDIVGLADLGKLKTIQITTGKEAIKSGWKKAWEYSREAYINLLLARPVTQVRNFLGNAYAAVNSSVERELAGWLSIDDANGVVKGEGMRQLQGMIAGIGDGISAFGKAFTKLDPAEASKLDYLPHQIPGLLGRIINAPGDALRGMDNFFKEILKRGDMYAPAAEKGTHLGLEGKALADYVARHVNMPTQQMLEHAKDFALNQTFQNDLGTLGKAAQKFGQAGPLVYLFPFMKTPINLAKYAWNRTPGLQLISQSLYHDILAGGTRADMAIGRLTLSNMMGLFWYGLAKQGLITGGGPVDPQLKRSWGKQPYSIMGASGWYPITNIEPGTTTVNLIADFAEIHNQLDDPTAEQTAMAITLAGVRDIVDKSYWQTVGQMVDLIGAARAGEEPGKNAMQIVEGPAVTAASGGPLGAGIARVEDPVRREARSFVDQVKARVPGYSDTLPPMRDGYGDPIVPPQALSNQWLGLISPFVYKPEETDEIKKEGARLQAKLPAFPWSTGGGKLRDDFDIRTALPGDALPVELTPQQRDRWQVIYREMLQHPEMGIKARVLDTDEYKNAPFALQRQMFMNYLANAREGAKASLMTEDIPLAKKVVSATAAKYLPMVQPQDRPAVEQQVNESLDLLDTLLPQERDNLLKWGILGSGKQRDEESIRQQGGYRGEITKPLSELNAGAAAEGQTQ